jgi:hypothetical protein
MHHYGLIGGQSFQKHEDGALIMLIHFTFKGGVTTSLMAMKTWH